MEVIRPHKELHAKWCSVLIINYCKQFVVSLLYELLQKIYIY